MRRSQHPDNSDDFEEVSEDDEESDSQEEGDSSDESYVEPMSTRQSATGNNHLKNKKGGVHHRLDSH